MANARWFIAAVLLTLTLAGANLTTAQVAVKAEDLIGTWEIVSAKDLKTGNAVRGLYDATTALQWMLFTRSHWMVSAMQRDRSVVSHSEFAKLSPEEKVKANYARAWNETNQQIFASRGGTYRVDGDEVHKKVTIALYTDLIGAERVMKIISLDKSQMIAQVGVPYMNPTNTWELTFRRIE
jgi:hypothetical protein